MNSPTLLYLLAVERRDRFHAEARSARLARQVRSSKPTTSGRLGRRRNRGQEDIL